MEIEYISKEAAIATIEYEELKACHQPILMTDIYKALRDVPAADVRPAVRGEWKNGHCSNCGNDIASRLDSWTNIQSFFFCPKCGADMREEDND